MDDGENEYDALERILIDASAEPIPLSYAFLRKITNDFSQVIGSGGYGVVFMGFLRNQNVAVKKLSRTDDFSEKQFEDELTCLIRVKHKNIVRFVGYCSDTQRIAVEYNGKLVLADDRRRLLCFEYVPNKSLHDYLKDESQRRDWNKCYQIIEGICQGLHYLHNDERINHLDLKPANILLDADMVPKITDFGLSRRFGGEQSRMITKSIFGTLGYAAPEYCDKGEISFKSDIFSLGMIIRKVLMGRLKNDFDDWHQPRDVDCPQVKTCIKIAQLCMDDDPSKRPTIDQIIDVLNGKETVTEMVSPVLGHSRNNSWSSLEQMGSELLDVDTRKHHSASEASSSSVSKVVGEHQSMDVYMSEALSLPRTISVPKDPRVTRTEMRILRTFKTRKLLDVHPLELYFPFERHKSIKCPLTLTNRTDYYVKFCITPTCCRDTHSDDDFHFQVFTEGNCQEDPCSSLLQVVEPHSTLVVSIAMEEQQQPPRQDTFKFQVLMIMAVLEEHLQYMKPTYSYLDMDTDFLKRVDDFGGAVHVEMLKLVICDPANYHQTVIHKFIPAASEFGYISCIDAHPTKTWILVGHRGHVSIWNYQTQEKVMVFQATKAHSNTPCWIQCARFIVGRQWFVTGDDDGWVNVYAYTTKDKIKSISKDKIKGFTAHDGHPIFSLAIHPTDPFLLTVSPMDTVIKLWDWSQDWMCTRTFNLHNTGLHHITWNLRDTSTFASVSSYDGSVKLWDMDSSYPTTLEGSYRFVHYYAGSHRYSMVTADLKNKSYAYVWDLQSHERIHKFGVPGKIMKNFACHPTRPLFATTSLNLEGGGTVYLWDPRTYRLEKMVELKHGIVQDVVFTRSKDSTRLVVGCLYGISIIEMNLPTD